MWVRGFGVFFWILASIYSCKNGWRICCKSVSLFRLLLLQRCQPPTPTSFLLFALLPYLCIINSVGSAKQTSAKQAFDIWIKIVELWFAHWILSHTNKSVHVSILLLVSVAGTFIWEIPQKMWRPMPQNDSQCSLLIQTDLLHMCWKFTRANLNVIQVLLRNLEENK